MLLILVMMMMVVRMVSAMLTMMPMFHTARVDTTWSSEPQRFVPFRNVHCCRRDWHTNNDLMVVVLW